MQKQVRSPELQVRRPADKSKCTEEHEMSTEEQQECDRMAAAIISDDPHAVLVEFSSVVADTQEYIIGVSLLHSFFLKMYFSMLAMSVSLTEVMLLVSVVMIVCTSLV